MTDKLKNRNSNSLTSDWESDEDIEASLLEFEADSIHQPKSNESFICSSSIIVSKLNSTKHEPIDCSTPMVSAALKDISNRVLLEKNPIQPIQRRSSISGSKRKFPGPAGTLPKLNQSIDLKKLQSTPAVCEDVGSPVKDVTSSQCSQPLSVVDNRMWQRLVEDLEISRDHLQTHCIKNALANGSKKKLPDGKVPLLVVVVEHINKSYLDATVTLKDLTGSMQGVIHRILMKNHGDELKMGSALLLKQTAVFSPSPRRQYLNITPNNLLQIYSEGCETQSISIVSTVVNKLNVPLQTLLQQPVVESVLPKPKDTQVANTNPNLFTLAGKSSSHLTNNTSTPDMYKSSSEPLSKSWKRLKTGGEKIQSGTTVSNPVQHDSKRLTNQISLTSSHQGNIADGSNLDLFEDEDDDEFGDLELDDF